MTKVATRTMCSVAVVVLASAFRSSWQSSLAYAPAPRPLSALYVLRSSADDTVLDVFAGIVEETGTIVDIQERGDTATTSWNDSSRGRIECTIRCDNGVVARGAFPGCGICVSGVRLTTTAIDPSRNAITVGLASEETLDKTWFRSLQRGQVVNLERANPVVGGNLVRGCVDGSGTIVENRAVDGEGLRIKVDEGFVDGVLRRVAPGGWVAIDGALLDVTGVDRMERIVCVMPGTQTQKKVAPIQKSIGEKVNIEVGIHCCESAMASVFSRLDALEAKVEMLEQRLSRVGGSKGRIHNKDFDQSRMKSSARNGRMIQEATPSFGNYIQEGTPGYSNPSLSAARRKRKYDDGNKGIRFVTIQGSF
mmetsp:Transcript_12913/g.36373  ORF Transcript_12913/g.36373 Transcript_12913/m.36373 type:complete len:364 (+) Transcript_12913:185-1276(+)